MTGPKIAPIFREIELSFAAHSSPRARSQKLAAVALEGITEAKIANGGGNGKLAPHRQIVDGREGAALISVKPDGVIVARFNLLAEVLDFIGAEIERGSPVLTGRFRRSHVLYIDGDPHEPGTPYRDGRDYAFMNTQPYARKIERGLSKQIPTGLYEGIAVVAEKRFGNIAKVGFSWRPLQDAGALETWASKTKLQRGDRTLKGAALEEWLRRQPCIFVRPH